MNSLYNSTGISEDVLSREIFHFLSIALVSILFVFGFPSIDKLNAEGRDEMPVVGEHTVLKWRTSSGLQGEDRVSIKSQKEDKGIIGKSINSNLFRVNSSSDEAFIRTVRCHTSDADLTDRTAKSNHGKSEFRPLVPVYLEVDHQSFIDNNANLEETIEWISVLFDNVRDIYALHNIDVFISELFIWDTPDIYGGDFNPTDLLKSFGERIKNEFDGAVAQLCTTRAIGGGKAVLGALCTDYNDETHEGPYSVASSLSISDDISITYNWSVYVMAHELGHVLGSPHTHACFWGVDGYQSLDNCSATEGNCPAQPTSSTPGGVMSYCYLQPRGIDFNLGLDAQPGSYVHDLLMGSECIVNSCVNLPCDDGDACTINDYYDGQCNCIGNLIDLNKNLLCDLLEDCPDTIVIESFELDTTVFFASKEIILNSGGIIHPDTLILSSQSEISIMEWVRVDMGHTLEVYNFGCKED